MRLKDFFISVSRPIIIPPFFPKSKPGFSFPGTNHRLEAWSRHLEFSSFIMTNHPAGLRLPQSIPYGNVFNFLGVELTMLFGRDGGGWKK